MNPGVDFQSSVIDHMRFDDHGRDTGRATEFHQIGPGDALGGFDGFLGGQGLALKVPVND